MLPSEQQAINEPAAVEEPTAATKNDKLQELAQRLALSYQEVRILPGEDVLLGYLDSFEKRISEAYLYFQQITSDKLVLSYASEWILDNYYVIRQAFRQIREDLPPGYDQKLPRLVQPPFKKYPRVYGITHSLAEFSQLKLDLDDTRLVLQRFQETTPLTMGEIWAVPIFLRYLVLETLAVTLDRIISPDKKKNEPTPPVELTINLEDVVANCVVSLRDISNLDWNEFFEQVSLVNRISRTGSVRCV